MVIIFRNRIRLRDEASWKCWVNCFRRERFGPEIRSFRLRLSADENFSRICREKERGSGNSLLFPEQFVEHSLPERVENVQFGKGASVAEREGNRCQTLSRGVQRIEFYSLFAGERYLR